MEKGSIFGLEKGKVFAPAELWVCEHVFSELYRIRKKCGFAVVSLAGGDGHGHGDLEKFLSVTVELIDDSSAAVIYNGEILYSSSWRVKADGNCGGSASWTDAGVKLMNDFEKLKEDENVQK